MLLSIINIFKESLKHVLTHKLVWLKVGFAPLVLFFVGEIFTSTVFIVLGDTIGVLEFSFLHLSAFTISATFSVLWGGSFYLRGYRYAILDEGGDRWWRLPVNRRLLKVIIYILFMGLVVSIPLIGLQSFVVYAYSVSYLWGCFALGPVFFWIYCISRLSLVFLLIGVDEKNPLKNSWKMMEHHVFQLVGLMLLIGFALLAFILAAFLLMGCLWLVLDATIPAVAHYFWLVSMAIFGKCIFFLTNLPIIGFGLEGCVNFVFNVAFGVGVTMIGGEGSTYLFIIMNILFMTPLLLLTWALTTKALSLFYCAVKQDHSTQIFF